MGRITSEREQACPLPDASALHEPDPTRVQVKISPADTSPDGLPRLMLWSVDTSARLTGYRCLTCEALVAGPVPASQFGNSPGSGRPPVERFPRQMSAPGGWSDTTTPGERRCGSPAAGQAVINRCVQLPLISVEPGTGSRPELAVALVLQQVHGGLVITLKEGYRGRGLSIMGRLARAFGELTAARLLVLVDPAPHGRRRVTLTTAGQARYDQLRGTPRPPVLPVPAPQFAAIKALAREPVSGSGPLGPSEQPSSGAGPLRWARCPDEGRLHLLAPADVVVAATSRHAEALCGRALAAVGLTLTHGSSEALCMTCVSRVPSDPGPRGTP